MTEKMVTSIKVDKELWREAKIHAIKNGVTLYEFLEQALRNKIRADKEEGR